MNIKSLAMAAALGAAWLLPQTSVASNEGCKIMLCLSYPKWDQISECEATVRKALKRAAQGHSMPRCSLSKGNTNSTATRTIPLPASSVPPFEEELGELDDDAADSQVRQEAVAPKDCPVQYRQIVSVRPVNPRRIRDADIEDGSVIIKCRYTSRVAVVIDGQPWTNTFFDENGETRTQVCPAALAAGLPPDEKYLADANATAAGAPQSVEPGCQR